jgi:hypothetical protein
MASQTSPLTEQIFCSTKISAPSSTGFFKHPAPNPATRLHMHLGLYYATNTFNRLIVKSSPESNLILEINHDGGVHSILQRDHIRGSWNACTNWKRPAVQEFIQEYKNDPFRSFELGLHQLHGKLKSLERSNNQQASKDARDLFETLEHARNQFHANRLTMPNFLNTCHNAIARAEQSTLKHHRGFMRIFEGLFLAINFLAQYVKDKPLFQTDSMEKVRAMKDSLRVFEATQQVHVNLP